jgi:hypothetical protein
MGFAGAKQKVTPACAPSPRSPARAAAIETDRSSGRPLHREMHARKVRGLRRHGARPATPNSMKPSIHIANTTAPRPHGLGLASFGLPRGEDARNGFIPLD